LYILLHLQTIIKTVALWLDAKLQKRYCDRGWRRFLNAEAAVEVVGVIVRETRWDNGVMQSTKHLTANCNAQKVWVTVMLIVCLNGFSFTNTIHVIFIIYGDRHLVKVCLYVFDNIWTKSFSLFVILLTLILNQLKDNHSILFTVLFIGTL